MIKIQFDPNLLSAGTSISFDTFKSSEESEVKVNEMASPPKIKIVMEGDLKDFVFEITEHVPSARTAIKTA